jgi:hypothetical protein
VTFSSIFFVELPHDFDACAAAAAGCDATGALDDSNSNDEVDVDHSSYLGARILKIKRQW